MHKGEAATSPIELDLPDESATMCLGRRLAGLAAVGDVIALRGDLGAGKTTLARGFITGLPDPEGGSSDEEIPSPTFSLVQIYMREPANVWHADLYRIERPEEVLELGLEEALAEGILLIEWPERMGYFLPRERLDVTIEFVTGKEGRRVKLNAGPGWQGRLYEVPSGE